MSVNIDHILLIQLVKFQEGESSTWCVSKLQGADGGQEEKLADELKEGDREIATDGQAIIDFDFDWS